MSAHNITQADLDNLRINDRAPRIVREYHDRAEVIEALAQTIPVHAVSQLTEARNAQTQLIADILHTDRRGMRLPQGHLVLLSKTGVRLTQWEASQRERVRDGLTSGFIAIREDVQAGVVRAWEAARS